MTGYSRNAIVHQDRLDPGVDLIQKPLTSGQLAAAISKMLDAWTPRARSNIRRPGVALLRTDDRFDQGAWRLACMRRGTYGKAA
jgi:hypothetical protein